MVKPVLLATKVLDAGLRERITHAGLAYVGYNAIRIEAIPFEVPSPSSFVVLSSKNATKLVLKHLDWLQQTKVLCVGETSEILLNANDVKPFKTALNMAELIDFIKKMDKKGSFLHFCGNQRLPLFAEKMTQRACDFKEVVVYHTKKVRKVFNEHPDAVLFFSPSGVESYEQHNELSQSICFCIGATTAKAFKQRPKEIHVANSPKIAHVVTKAIHYFKTQQYA